MKSCKYKLLPSYGVPRVRSRLCVILRDDCRWFRAHDLNWAVLEAPALFGPFVWKGKHHGGIIYMRVARYTAIPSFRKAAL